MQLCPGFGSALQGHNSFSLSGLLLFHICSFVQWIAGPVPITLLKLPLAQLQVAFKLMAVCKFCNKRNLFFGDIIDTMPVSLVFTLRNSFFTQGDLFL